MAATRITFIGGTHLDVTENLEEVNDGLLAGRGSRVVFQKANGGRPVYIEPASIAYLEEAPSKKATSF